jgi:hypothetical protein
MATTDKPSQNEDEYFARRDAELLQHHRKALTDAEASAERKSHQHRCPKCGGHLQVVDFHRIQIDRCPECLGIWLDAGELDLVLGHRDPTFLRKVFGDLFTSLKKK